MRLIDADVLLNHLEDFMSDEFADADMKRTAFAISIYVSGMPTIEAEPVKRAKWEICCDGYYPYCSNCQSEPQGRVMTDFCPNCGARMKE